MTHCLGKCQTLLEWCCNFSDGELTDEISLVVKVRNLNDTSPVFTTTQITTPENQTIIGQVLATDPDGDDLVFDVEAQIFLLLVRAFYLFHQ